LGWLMGLEHMPQGNRGLTEGLVSLVSVPCRTPELPVKVPGKVPATSGVTGPHQNPMLARKVAILWNTETPRNPLPFPCEVFGGIPKFLRSE